MSGVGPLVKLGGVRTVPGNRQARCVADAGVDASLCLRGVWWDGIVV